MGHLAFPPGIPCFAPCTFPFSAACSAPAAATACHPPRQRRAPPWATLGGFQGQASDIEIHAKEILFIKERLNQILAHHTGQPLDVIARDTDRDRFMSGDEAVKYGLIDKVMTQRDLAV